MGCSEMCGREEHARQGRSHVFHSKNRGEMGNTKVVKARELPYYSHEWKNVLLLLLSFITIPFSAFLVFIGIAASTLHHGKAKPPPKPRGASNRKTILVTGVSMTKGLTIARSLSQNTSHRVIGADISSLSPGRFSSAITRYYRLDTPNGDDAEPYIDSILSVLRNEKVDLWISCSSVLAAVEDGQVVRLAQKEAKIQGRNFQAIQFSEDVVEKLHEKDRFIDHIASLNLTIPESYRCTSADAALNILLRAFDDDTPKHIGNEATPLGKQFIMKSIGVDDRARNAMMTLLPLETAEKTTSYIRSLNISKSNPFQLQQFIQGKEYCTHALVIQGHVKAFTSCPSSELLMHYKPLPAYSALSQEMLKFTEKVAQDGGPNFTGHLSFDFLVEGHEKGDEIILYPIECNPRAHTAVILFEQTPEMADAYLSVFESAAAQSSQSMPVYPRAPTKSYYWLGHDLVALGLLPVLDAGFGRGSWRDAFDQVVALARHIVYWKDGTYTLADPWPFFVLYHVYWPMKFLQSLRTGKAWSRINVSTTKMFEI